MISPDFFRRDFPSLMVFGKNLKNNPDLPYSFMRKKQEREEVISKVIQKMASDAIRKELQRVVCTC